MNILNHFEKVASCERKWNGTKHDQTCEPKSGSILTCWFAGTGVILTVLETAVRVKLGVPRQGSSRAN